MRVQDSITSPLEQTNILLGISGGIAAYKSVELVRLLKQHKANVRVVLTANATHFVTPLTLETLAEHPVYQHALSDQSPMDHIDLAKWANMILIAPATADLIAQLALGLSGDLLSTLCLATKAPTLIVPAMNQNMWSHPATQHNIAILKQRNYPILGPDDGWQACGDIGPGRMLDPENIITELIHYQKSFSASNASTLAKKLYNRKVVITAGPTREALDPVRYLSNHSSGKMGFALAIAAQKAGAKVTLIAGPVQQPTPNNMERIDVISTEEMNTAVAAQMPCDIFIAAAAVADYRPKITANKKIKKQQQALTLPLEPTPDIITNVATMNPRPFCVGFAAETNQVIQHAKRKLVAKQIDIIIANDVSQKDIGFNSEHNSVSVIWLNKDNKEEITTFKKQPKLYLAEQLISLIHQRWSKNLSYEQTSHQTSTNSLTQGS